MLISSKILKYLFDDILKSWNAMYVNFLHYYTLPFSAAKPNFGVPLASRGATDNRLQHRTRVCGMRHYCCTVFIVSNANGFHVCFNDGFSIFIVNGAFLDRSSSFYATKFLFAKTWPIGFSCAQKLTLGFWAQENPIGQVLASDP